jgi:hypothetical protein
VHYFALAAMANGILHTAIGPHEGHMRRRDFGAQLGGGLRRAVPAPQRNAQEPASSRREVPRSRWRAGCIRSGTRGKFECHISQR